MAETQAGARQRLARTRGALEQARPGREIVAGSQDGWQRLGNQLRPFEGQTIDLLRIGPWK